MADLTAASAALACATSSRSIHARSVSSFTVLRCQNRPRGRQHRFESPGTAGFQPAPHLLSAAIPKSCPATFHCLFASSCLVSANETCENSGQSLGRMLHHVLRRPNSSHITLFAFFYLLNLSAQLYGARDRLNLEEEKQVAVFLRNLERHCRRPDTMELTPLGRPWHGAGRTSGPPRSRREHRPSHPLQPCSYW